MLNYYGSKWMLAEWIIGHFPDHEIYCEVFGGSAAVLLRKYPSKREVLNDLDSEIFNLYEVLRHHPMEIAFQTRLTAHSREDFNQAHTPSTDPIERARRTIIRSFFGIGDSLAQKNGFRTSKSSSVSVSASWANWNDELHELLVRLRNVTIENLPWQFLIEKYDSPSTFFYFDPPYVKSTRGSHGYNADFSDADHKELLLGISALEGMAVLSGYDSELYADLKWEKKSSQARTQGTGSAEETLWLCPKTVMAQRQMDFTEVLRHDS